MPPAARVIIDPDPRPGPMNMAIDEVLLESALDRGIHTLRFYQWSQPTLSLGYFQKPNDPNIPASLRRLPIVQRLSGGGAIVHHYEWTYSCAVPAASPLARVPSDLYTRMHNAIVNLLRRHGIDAALRSDANVSDDAKQQSDSAFLCFTRGDPNDVMLAGHKILGSAQRRRRGAILQHGSLMWRASEYAPELSGICDLATAPADLERFHTELAAGMGSQLGESLYDTSLTEEEMHRAGELERARYGPTDRD
jgi:lipoate-protein ligase A